MKYAIHKFGGTSVLNADRIKNVAKIILDLKSQPPYRAMAVVVSAMKGVTDDLIQAAKQTQPKEELAKIRSRHLETLKGLGVTQLEQVFEKDLVQIETEFKGAQFAEVVSGFGEVWSAQILAAYLETLGTKCAYLDARKVLTISASKAVDWQKSEQALKSWIPSHSITPDTTLVITGFVASTPDGRPTTLGRNGSDFSASIFGRLLDASEITIWTDVDGVLSADPRLVKDAVLLREMSYSEMTELANFGAKVVHPATMEPAIKNQIPIWIKNTFNPTLEGTKIHAGAKSTFTVKGFSAIENMALINLEGSGLMGIAGVSERMFGALRTANISVVMISQASSEHSISIAVSNDEAKAAAAAISLAFKTEMELGLVDPISTSKNKSILAAVGDNMVHKPGVAGQFFTALGRAGVSINSIAQGASERNISAVIEGNQTRLALHTVHSSFYLSPQTLGLAVIGTGMIGKAFIQQIEAEASRLKNQFGIDLRILATSNSREMTLFSPTSSSRILPLDLALLISSLKESALPHLAIVDATSSSTLISHYLHWLRQGFHIITPNKKANTQSMVQYHELRAVSQQTRRRFLYSTNVGAGLPILSTIKNLVSTGDELQSLDAVISGTLSYLLNQYDGKGPFSNLVKKAQDLGYTEPDPKEDLSGMDVARKLVILAREFGQSIELHEIPVQGLLETDEQMLQKFMHAKSHGQILRYVGSLRRKNATQQGQIQLPQFEYSVGLRSFPLTSPMASLGGADNLVSIQTKRYFDRPLVIQGPGAGPEVTAAGVFADVLTLIQSIGDSP